MVLDCPCTDQPRIKHGLCNWENEKKKGLLFPSWCEILVFLFRKARWGPKQAGVTVFYKSCVTSETLLSMRLRLPENFSCSKSNDCSWKSHLICLPESGKVSFTSTLKVPACLSWVMITHSLLKLYLIAAQRHYLIFKSTYLIFFLSRFINNTVF